MLAVLVGTDPDDWLRVWRETVSWTPSGHVLVSVDDTTRAVAAGSVKTNDLPGKDVTVVTVQADVELANLVDVVSRNLDPVGGALAPVAFLDSLSSMLTAYTRPAVLDFLDEFTECVDRVDGHGQVLAGDDLDPDDLDAVAEMLAVVDWSPRTLEARLRQLAQDDPTNYGYLRRHWREAKRGIEATGQNYPQARQIHKCIETPAATTRALGSALKALAQLGVIDVWDDTVSANRYDLTQYDPRLMRAIGGLLDADADPDE